MSNPATHLHVSRRDFLSTTVAAGAAVALAGCSMAEFPARPADSFRANSPIDPQPITLRINGRDAKLQIEPRVTLLDALRDHLHLTGTKKGCDHGQCGACTVLINNTRMNSCLTLAMMHVGADIITVEGLAKPGGGDELHPVQQAFIEHDAFQCGYCTPGQICSAVGLLHEGHAKTDADIRELMSGNICRCGAYPNIVSAVRQAMGKTTETPT